MPSSSGGEMLSDPQRRGPLGTRHAHARAAWMRNSERLTGKLSSTEHDGARAASRRRKGAGVVE